MADTNRGRIAGSDVIEGYVHDPASTGEPPEQLRAFTKVSLGPGQTRVAALVFHPGAFAYWNSGPATGTTPGTTSPTTPSAVPSPQPGGQWMIAPGRYRIDIGGSAERFDDSVGLRTSRRQAQDAILNGLFDWPLRGAGAARAGP